MRLISLAGRCPHSLSRAACLAGLCALGPLARAEGLLDALTPSALFAQAGFAKDARAYVVGATWNWAWTADLGWGTATGYWESSLGRWKGQADPEGHTTALVTQFGLTPVVRVHPSKRSPPWFIEAGIGANLLFPVYRSRDKSFSTTFNFGDHLALGRTFGARDEHELALRVQHFSNAGIKHPNPGENFLQLRYACRF
jgi:hypothetical protein